MPDQSITCFQCSDVFRLTEKEQAFFLSRNLNLPKRCTRCRKVKREQMAQIAFDTLQRAKMPVTDTTHATFWRRLVGVCYAAGAPRGLGRGDRTAGVPPTTPLRGIAR